MKDFLNRISLILLTVLLVLASCNNSKYRYYNVCAASDSIGIHNPYEGGNIMVTKQDTIYDKICEFYSKTDTRTFKYYNSDLKVHSEFIPLDFYKSGKRIHEIIMVLHDKSGWVMIDRDTRYICPTPQVDIFMESIRQFTYHYVYGNDKTVIFPKKSLN